MRVHASMQDPPAYLCDVLLNGEQLFHCLEANDVEGWAIVLVPPARDGAYIQEHRVGTVELRWHTLDGGVCTYEEARQSRRRSPPDNQWLADYDVVCTHEPPCNHYDDE